MRCKIYDIKKKRWLRPNALSYLRSKNSTRFLNYNCIAALDKNNNPIFEGDILRDKNSNEGIVYYAPEKAAYVWLNKKLEADGMGEYRSLGTQICKELEIIGHIVKRNGENDE